MTVHLLYLHETKSIEFELEKMAPGNVRVSDNGYKYSFYAFTKSNKYLREFMEKRNMNIFRHKEVEMDKDEYEKLCDDFPECLLEYHKFKSDIIRDQGGKVRSEYVEILSTGFEYDMVSYESNYIFQDLLCESSPWLVNLRSEYFNTKIAYYLNEVFWMDDILSWVRPMEEVPFLDTLNIDEASVYVYLFKKTYR